jgi:hypothetical protein
MASGSDDGEPGIVLSGGFSWINPREGRAIRPTKDREGQSKSDRRGLSEHIDIIRLLAILRRVKRSG